MTARAYPLPRPAEDLRFTFGLVRDLAKVLEAHGFPRVSGVDHVDLGQAVFRFVYSDPDDTNAAETARDGDQPRAARGHVQDHDGIHAAPPIGGGRTPRCGTPGRVALFAHAVTCPRCLAMPAEQDHDGTRVRTQRADMHLDLTDELLTALAIRPAVTS